jgi:hypothetical protein
MKSALWLSKRNQNIVSVIYAQRGTLVTNVFVVNSFGCSLPHLKSSSRKEFSNYLSFESCSVIEWWPLIVFG